MVTKRVEVWGIGLEGSKITKLKSVSLQFLGVEFRVWVWVGFCLKVGVGVESYGWGLEFGIWGWG